MHSKANIYYQTESHTLMSFSNMIKKFVTKMKTNLFNFRLFTSTKSPELETMLAVTFSVSLYNNLKFLLFGVW